MRRPASRRSGGPHGGTRGPHGSVEPVAPAFAPEPDLPGVAHTHGIGTQLAVAPEALAAHGGPGQALVEPVEPPLPDDSQGIGGQPAAGDCTGHGGPGQALV